MKTFSINCGYCSIVPSSCKNCLNSSKHSTNLWSLYHGSTSEHCYTSVSHYTTSWLHPSKNKTFVYLKPTTIWHSLFLWVLPLYFQGRENHLQHTRFVDEWRSQIQESNALCVCNVLIKGFFTHHTWCSISLYRNNFFISKWISNNLTNNLSSVSNDDKATQLILHWRHYLHNIWQKNA